MRSRRVTAALWIGFALAAAGMAYAAFWPDDLRDRGWFRDRLAAAKFVLAVLPVHAAVGLAAWAVLAAALRRWGVAAASLGLGSCLLAWAMPLIGPAVPEASGPTFRVMTANVRYDHADPEGLLAAVDEIEPDLLLIQEWAPIHENPLGLALHARFQHRVSAYGEATDVDGVAAFSRLPLEAVPLDVGASVPVPGWLAPKAQRLSSSFAIFQLSAQSTGLVSPAFPRSRPPAPEFQKKRDHVSPCSEGRLKPRNSN